MPSPDKFGQLIPKLLSYREKAGGKSWDLNYMLGTSYCHIPGQEPVGRIALYRVLGSYGLPERMRSAAEMEIAICGGAPGSAQEPVDVEVPVAGQMGPILRGKGGYEVNQTAEITTTQLAISPVPVSELQERLFQSNQAAKAVQAAMTRSGSVSKTRVAGTLVDGFVVTAPAGDLPPEETGRCLAQYRGPLQQQFQMQPPAALITVYAVAPESVSTYAAKLHGVSLPLGTVAYSVYQDLSIVGVASYDACGSLAHELTHLLIRQNFGDSPAWLEEGLASEVAIATPMAAAFRFDKSWRDATLARHWDMRPSVSQLLDATWASYATSDPSRVGQVAALHAMAATFIRYLEAKGRLVPVYVAMRDSLSSATASSDREILEGKLGMSLDQIDADFLRWFGKPSSYR